MALTAAAIAPQILITPTPTPQPLLIARQQTSRANTYQYPACVDDINGPCKLSSSSADACKRLVASLTILGFHSEYYCRCTNGFYDRSSECWNGCYAAGQKTTDLESISRKSRLVSLECESHSIGIDQDNARTIMAANRTAASAARSGSAGLLTSSEQSARGASVGVTAPPNVEETAAWVGRASTTGGGSSDACRKGRFGLRGVMGVTILVGMMVC